ncbi:MAG: hypothetical protein Q7V57_06005 [Actinomycetota bacterium]|nr:hypothetical protein [Actinomycetota bacterium]
MTAADEAPKGKLWVKIVLAVGCLAVAAMWIFAIFLSDDKGVYRIEDSSWRPQALKICAAADAAVVALADTEQGFITEPTPEQMAQRADLADQATDILDQMVTDLVAIPVDNDDDRTRLATFEENYRIVIADRREYTAALREGRNIDYSETVVGGGPVTNVITDFTAGVKGNEVPLCSPPGDLSRYLQPN